MVTKIVTGFNWSWKKEGHPQGWPLENNKGRKLLHHSIYEVFHDTFTETRIWLRDFTVNKVLGMDARTNDDSIQGIAQGIRSMIVSPFRAVIILFPLPSFKVVNQLFAILVNLETFSLQKPGDVLDAAVKSLGRISRREDRNAFDAPLFISSLQL